MGWKNWRGPELISKMSQGLRRAVSSTCYIVLEAAKQQVPHDEGTLMHSGMVIMAPDDSPAGVICFGGGPGTGYPIIPYAVRWHENSANFQKGRKRFYLKDPYNQLAAPTLKKALILEIGGILR